MSAGLDLLGDPLPEPLPSNERLRSEDDLVGHTIRAVFLDPAGRYQCEMVIVTDTGCWLVFDTESDGCCDDSASIQVKGHFGGDGSVLADYVSAISLKTAGVISQIEYDALKAIEDKRQADARALKADHLRFQLAALEKQGGAA